MVAPIGKEHSRGSARSALEFCGSCRPHAPASLSKLEFGSRSCRARRIAAIGLALEAEGPYMRRTMFLVACIVAATFPTSSGRPSAQGQGASALHLNPVIEKLAQGKAFVGVNTGDLSLENARTLARAPIDYVYVDMEHTPLNFDALHMFLLGMSDRGRVLRKG